MNEWMYIQNHGRHKPRHQKGISSSDFLYIITILPFAWQHCFKMFPIMCQLAEYVFPLVSTCIVNCEVVSLLMTYGHQVSTRHSHSIGWTKIFHIAYFSNIIKGETKNIKICLDLMLLSFSRQKIQLYVRVI